MAILMLLQLVIVLAGNTPISAFAQFKMVLAMMDVGTLNDKQESLTYQNERTCNEDYRFEHNDDVRYALEVTDEEDEKGKKKLKPLEPYENKYFDQWLPPLIMRFCAIYAEPMPIDGKADPNWADVISQAKPDLWASLRNKKWHEPPPPTKSISKSILSAVSKSFSKASDAGAKMTNGIKRPREKPPVCGGAIQDRPKAYKEKIVKKFSKEFPGFEWMSNLGGGKFGLVFKVRRISDGDEFALKVAECGSLEEEFKVTKSLAAKHDFVIPVFEYGQSAVSKWDYYTMLLLSGGSIYEMFAEGQLNGLMQKKILHEMLENISEMHGNREKKDGFAHGDLHSDNTAVHPFDRSRVMFMDLGKTMRVSSDNFYPALMDYWRVIEQVDQFETIQTDQMKLVVSDPLTATRGFIDGSHVQLEDIAKKFSVDLVVEPPTELKGKRKEVLKTGKDWENWKAVQSRDNFVRGLVQPFRDVMYKDDKMIGQRFQDDVQRNNILLGNIETCDDVIMHKFKLRPTSDGWIRFDNQLHDDPTAWVYVSLGCLGNADDLLKSRVVAQKCRIGKDGPVFASKNAPKQAKDQCFTAPVKSGDVVYSCNLDEEAVKKGGPAALRPKARAVKSGKPGGSSEANSKTKKTKKKQGIEEQVVDCPSDI